jgi:hypothetical protein
MKKMYRELKEKGLEVVGITQYYGWYGKPDQKMTQDQEFAKLKDYIEEWELPWPLIVGDKSNFDAYGVNGIPQYVVIDRDGKVKSITVGFNEPLHAELRKSVEEALAKAATTATK